MTGFDVMIPARIASVRLPGKPLLDVAGRALILRVLDAASASSADHVYVATDDDRIAQVVLDAGGLVQMTSSQHPSGTDRIAEAVDLLSLDDDRIIVNVQGDEPDMPAALIDQVADLLVHDETLGISTAATAIADYEQWRDPSVVKVVRDAANHALYFSRAPIPASQSEQDSMTALALRHIGIYGYRAGFVRRYASWPRCDLEVTEKLEQLRVLHHGEKIAVCEACAIPGAGVDTEEDLQRVRRLFDSMQ